MALARRPGFTDFYITHDEWQGYAAGEIAAAMLAAYQLRTDLRAFALGASADNPDRLFADAAMAWGIGQRRPHLATLFAAQGQGNSWSIDFLSTGASTDQLGEIHALLHAKSPAGMEGLRQLAFADWMTLTIGWSDNAAATACIRQLGAEYITRVVQELGLYDCGITGGLWLASEYQKLGPEFGATVSAVVDPISRSAQAGTALALADLLTAITYKKFMDAEACAQMQELLTRWDNQGPTWGREVSSPRG